MRPSKRANWSVGMEKSLIKLSGNLIIATGNAGKVREMEPMVKEYFDLSGSITGKAPEGAVESAPNFTGNARIKVDYIKNLLSPKELEESWILSDDSGLCVDALGGRPGVNSARYAGDHVAPEKHMEKLLKELSGLGSKAKSFPAHYTCALSLVSPQGDYFDVQGECHGEIIFDKRGDSGFGYDPIFYYPQLSKTFAEIPYDEKNKFSHRRRAFDLLVKALTTICPILMMVQSPLSHTSDLSVWLEKLRPIGLFTPYSYRGGELTLDEENISSAEIKGLFPIFFSHLEGQRIKPTQQNWKIINIPPHLQLPQGRPTNSYFNSKLLSYTDAASKKNFIFMPVDTVSGCDSGCSPIHFFLVYENTSSKFHLLPDPDFPLLKFGHQKLTPNEINFLNEMLNSLPGLSEAIVAPSSLTQKIGAKHQTWSVHQNSLVKDAAYTSYRVYEAALVLLDALGIKKSQPFYQQMADLTGELYRTNDLKSAQSTAEMAQGMLRNKLIPKSMKKHAQRAFEIATLYPYLAGFKKGRADFEQTLQKIDLQKSDPSMFCQLFLQLASDKDTQSLAKSTLLSAKYDACGEDGILWINYLSGKASTQNDIKKLGDSIPEFLLQDPDALYVLWKNLSSSELKNSAASELKTRYPDISKEISVSDAELSQSIEKLKSIYFASLKADIGVLPKVELKTIDSKITIPKDPYRIFIFFGSWCPHCQNLLKTMSTFSFSESQWKQFQLVELHASDNLPVNALSLCQSQGLPGSLCDRVTVVPQTPEGEKFKQQLGLSTVPRIVVINKSGQIIDFDLKVDISNAKLVEQKFIWALEAGN